jgi:hypothetical protein
METSTFGPVTDWNEVIKKYLLREDLLAVILLEQQRKDQYNLEQKPKFH